MLQIYNFLFSFLFVFIFPCYCFFRCFHFLLHCFFTVVAVTMSARNLREHFFFSQAFFTLHSFLLLSRLPWGLQFILEGCKPFQRGSKHGPGRSFCLNHIVFSKRYYLVASIYLLGSATSYYSNYLSLVLNSLY